ncbi:MAG: hypothetical protein R2882_06315 [Gemmatimonadales bacterium]
MNTVHTLESALFRSRWDDGLLDVLAGVGVLIVAACWAADLVAVGAAAPALLAVVWGPLRQRLVEPRAGFVEFSDARAQAMKRRSWSAVALGVGGLVAVGALVAAAMAGRDVVPNGIAPAVPAILLAMMAAVAGLALGVSRFVGYALLLVVAGLGAALAGAEPEMAMLAGGAAILLVGGWRLHRFLQLPVEPGEGEAP